MEENILIKSELHKGKFKKLYTFLAIITISLFVLAVIVNCIGIKSSYDNIIELLKDRRQYDYETGNYYYSQYYEYMPGEYTTFKFNTFEEFLNFYENGKYSSFGKYLLTRGWEPLFYVPLGIVLSIFGIICLSLIVIAFITEKILSKCQLSVTDKNVKGKALFGKEVVLPIHMISAYSTNKLFSTIAVTTSSGVTNFCLIKNYKEIAAVLSTLINQRQDSIEMKQSTPIVAEQPTNNLDELKKLKELLDMGIISQEEFDAKKKQLLEL